MPDHVGEDLPQDRELLVRLRAGDVTAFDTIYLRHYARLAAFAKRIARGAEPAADIVHDVFLALWEHRSRRVIVPPIAAYLYGAVRNRAISARRRIETIDRHVARLGETQAGLGTGPSASDPEQQLALASVRAALRAAFDQLPDRQRLAVGLFLYEQLSPGAIAHRLQISEQAVGKLLAKGMTTLCAVLDQAEG